MTDNEKEKKRREEQKQREEQKKRSLHKKHKDRRKKDIMPNLPFIVGFQGDPARDFYCNDEDQRDRKGNPVYELIPRRGARFGEMKFRRLSTYMAHKLTKILNGKVLVYKAA